MSLFSDALGTVKQLAEFLLKDGFRFVVELDTPRKNIPAPRIDDLTKARAGSLVMLDPCVQSRAYVAFAVVTPPKLFVQLAGEATSGRQVYYFVHRCSLGKAFAERRVRRCWISEAELYSGRHEFGLGSIYLTASVLPALRNT